jgi:membrane protease YdiL (CAAX protease family)
MMGNVLVVAVAGLQEAERVNSPALAVLFMLGLQATVVVLTAVAARIEAGDWRTRLVLTRPPKEPAVYIEAIIGAAGLMGLYTVVVYTTGLSDIVTDLKPFIELIRSPAWLMAILVVAVGAPLSEELLFRGFLLPALANSRLRFRGAAVLTTLAWTALHAGYSAAGMIEVMLVGFYLSWLMWRKGSLWVPLVCHAVVNTVLILGLLVLPIRI